MNKISVEIEVSKLHVALLSIVLLLASVSATVDLKDTLEMYGPIQMNDNAIKGLDSPESPQDAATKKYVDSNSGLGYSDKRYDYSRAYQLSGNSIRCDPFETLVDVTCHYAGSGGIDNQNNVPVKCDSRTRRSATQGGGLGGGGAIGTCLPPNGVKSQVFGQPESTNTFQIPPWADELSFEITGGNGGDGYASGGEGGLVNATILVGGTDEVRVYLGENGGSGSLGPDYRQYGPGPGGQGGCVSYPPGETNCGGDGRDNYNGRGGGGGGAPTILTDGEGNLLAAAGGGGGRRISDDIPGGGGAGGGVGGNNADAVTGKAVGGNADSDGGAFVAAEITDAETGTSGEGPSATLVAIGNQ